MTVQKSSSIKDSCTLARWFCFCVVFFLALQITPASAQPIQGEVEAKPQSSFTNAVLSLVVPGLGEARAGRFDVGRYLSASEVLVWGGYIGLSGYANSFQNDMETFAISHAGAGASKRGDGDYFAHVGQYQSAELYNEELLREGRGSERILDPNEQWSWKTKDDQKSFDKLRIKAQTLDNDRQFFVAAIVVNHVLSAIDAFIVTRKYNKGLEGTSKFQGLRIGAGASQGGTYDPVGATVGYQLHF